MNEQIGNKINDKTYIKLTPFKGFVLENFPFIEADFDAITNYQLLCKVIEYLNNVIANQNTVQELGTDLVNAYNSLVDAVNLAINEFETDVTTDINQFKVDINNDFDEFTSNITTQFNNLKDYVDNYFDNNFPQMISDKLDEMAEDGTLENLLNDSAHLTKSYNTYTDMMADSSSFTNGLRLKTLGYYNINDGGGANYFVNNQVVSSNYQIDLQNGLYLNLILSNNVNIKQFGAKGDDTNDDTLSIQNAIDYSYDNNIKEVFVPFGTYKITKPLFLYTDIKIFGDNSNSSIIHKTTSTKSDVTGYDVDAIIILTNRELNSNNQSSRQEIDNIQLVGNVSEYVANKVDKQYAIYSKVYSPKIKITNFLINHVDYGIYTPSMYTGLIQNCVGLEAHYGAIASYTESQGVSISNINTTGTHEFGIKLSGGSYSTLSNILVEWNYGNICYDLQFYRGNMINCGAELGTPGFNTAIRLINSNITLNGGTLACDRNNENLKMFDLDNSSLKIENVNFGQTNDQNPYVGIFANITNKSSLIISKGCKFTSAFNGGVTRSGANNSITIEDTKINLTTASGVSSIAGSSNVYEGEVVEFINNKILNLPIKLNSIYSGFTTSQNTNNTQNIEYYKSFNKGDIGIYDNPTVNGSAMWLCNKNNASLEEPQTIGTISSISGSTMILTDVKIENYTTNGYRLFPYCTIKGVTSGITKTLIGVSFTSNTLYFNDATNLDQFQIGEHIAIASTPYVRNGDYLHIPIINAGESSQRPTQNVVNGTMFFDTTLGKPIWYNRGHWYDSSGTQV